MDDTGRDAVAQTLIAYLATLNDADWDGFRAYFTDDATCFSPWAAFAGRATGREAVEAAFQPSFARWRSTLPGPPFLQIEPDDLWVQMIDDVAVVTFHTHDEDALGRRTLVLRHGDDGWKIVHLHASYLVPSNGLSVM